MPLLLWVKQLISSPKNNLQEATWNHDRSIIAFVKIILIIFFPWRFFSNIRNFWPVIEQEMYNIIWSFFSYQAELAIISPVDWSALID